MLNNTTNKSTVNVLKPDLSGRFLGLHRADLIFILGKNLIPRTLCSFSTGFEHLERLITPDMCF